MGSNVLRIVPYEFLHINSLCVSQELGRHGEATIVGVIGESLEDEYISLAADSVECSVSSLESNQVVFTGHVSEIEIDVFNDTKIMTLRLTANTRLMDMAEHTRTFQNIELTYKDILNQIGKYEDYLCLSSHNADKQTEELVVQYRETDWDFIKRIASNLNLVAIPRCMGQGTEFYFGLPNNSPVLLSGIEEYSIQKDINNFRYKRNRELKNIVESDSKSYLVKTKQFVGLGEKVIFKNNEYHISAITTFLEGSEVYNKYTLHTKEILEQPSTKNERIAGTALEAVVIDVKSDMVKVHILVDPVQLLAEAKWFPYSTVYSSPDGTGWYAMPEIGDRVRVYFPSCSEDEGYIISSVNLDVSGNADGARTNPENKSIKNKYGKEVLLTPTTAIMTNNNGMNIIIDDENGIMISSDKKITITSKEALGISSFEADIDILGKNGIEIKQGENGITIKDDVTFAGLEVNIQ